MKVVKLSAFGAEQIDASRRSTQGVQVERGFAEVEVMEARAGLDQARRSKSLIHRALGRTSAAERSAQQSYDEAVSRAERQAAAERHGKRRTGQRKGGEAGEQRFATQLSEWLGGEWTLFQGYLSRAGEADAVVVGPNGLWAVEVKTWRARLSVDGDDWTYVRVDNRGRPTGEPKPAVDGGNRTWGRQVMDAADALGQVLERAECGVPIQTAVVLMSRAAEVSVRGDPGVDLVIQGVAGLAKAVRSQPLSIGLLERRQIEEIIVADHEARASAKAKRKRSGGPARKQRPGRAGPPAARDR